MSKSDRILSIGIVAFSLFAARVLNRYGYAPAWQYAWLAIGTCWFFIVGFVDQIRRNRFSARADQQLSWNAQLAGVVENLAWVVLSSATADAVIFVSCIPGLLLGQVVLAQMLFTTEAVRRRSTAYVWLAALSTVSIAAILVLPLFFSSLVRTPAIITLIAGLTTAATYWSAGGWAYQMRKNAQCGWLLTGRDFSIKVPIAFVCSASAWLLHEYTEGMTGWPIYFNMGAIIAIHTGLIAQVTYYRLLAKVEASSEGQSC